MTTVTGQTTWRERIPSPPARSGRLPSVQLVKRAKPPEERVVIASYALTLLSATVLVVLLNLTVVGQLQHFTAQHRLYDDLRVSLAEGSAPLGQLDINGSLVAPGTPVALLEIPRLGVREVVVEGTTSRQTKLGVGHRRDTPLPGQPGISVLMGRASAYGGVFRSLDRLRSGDTVKVTTGQGQSTYRVNGPRVGATQLPALGDKDGRLTLVTAKGRPFQVSGVLRVDAALETDSYPRPPFASTVINHDEEVLAGDRSPLFALSWLLELLVVLAIAAVWSWKRWGHLATWIVFTPVIALTALASADRVCDLLPNLM